MTKLTSHISKAHKNKLTIIPNSFKMKTDDYDSEVSLKKSCIL